jgi:hypothetical protein
VATDRLINQSPKSDLDVEPSRPYDANATCPKCGNGGATTVWRPGTVRISRVLGLATASGPAEPGWMHRTCGTCEYDWAEEPLS